MFQSSVVRDAGIFASATIDQLDTNSDLRRNTQLATPWYSDQVLPFDVTLSGANEYGAMCAAKIFGLEILNEGMGISIDNAVTEMQAKPGLSFVPAYSPPSGTAPINGRLMPVDTLRKRLFALYSCLACPMSLPGSRSSSAPHSKNCAT